MKVLILAPGTRGDVAPASGLGAGFVADGHEVTVVAGAEYGQLVRDSGCTHVPIHEVLTPPSGSAQGDPEERSEPGVRAYLATLRTYMDAAATAALGAASGSDVILTNAISPYGHDIAEHLGVPSAEALLQPAHPSSAYPPMVASTRDLGAVGNQLAGRLAQLVRTPYDPACARVRSELGLRPESRRIAQRRRRAERMPVHHGISPTVLPQPADWPPELSLDGFWWPPVPASWSPPADLTAFLAAGSPPVVVSLGSLPAGAKTAPLIAEALKAGTVRVILQGDQFRQVADQLGPDRAIHVGDIPHEWLLPQVVAVAHQAGAGISSAALRAGVPSVPLPMHTDQPFWARRLVALSAATSPIPLKRLTAGQFGSNIEEAMTSTILRDGARAVRDRLIHEDGTQPLRSWLRQLSGSRPDR